jgi:hypothetical protein
MSTPHPARTGAVVVLCLMAGAAATAALLTGAADLASTVRAREAATLDDGIAAAATVGGWGCLLWLVLALLLQSLATLPGLAGAACGAVAARVTPRLVHRLACMVLGLTLAGPVAHASAIVPLTAATSSSGIALHLEPPDALLPAVPALPDLDRPADIGADESSGTAVASPAPALAWTPPMTPRQGTTVADARLVSGAAHPQHTVTDDVVVRRGDTLWAIAARHLGPGATAAEVAEAWPRWHEANRDVIGTDPDRLLPGQVLTPPR